MKNTYTQVPTSIIPRESVSGIRRYNKKQTPDKNFRGKGSFSPPTSHRDDTFIQ